MRPGSARAKRHGDGDDRLWRVPGSGQVPVEHPAYRVARQVLQDRIDDQLMGPWRPRLARQPAATIAPRGPVSGRRPRVGRRGPTTRRQRPSRPWSSGRSNATSSGSAVPLAGTVTVHALGFDVAALVGTDLVAPFRARPGAGSPGASRNPSSTTSRTACRSAAGSRPGGVRTSPRLIRAGSSRTVSRRRSASHSSYSVGSSAPASGCAGIVDQPDVRGRVALAHRRREPARTAGASCAAPRPAVGRMPSTSVVAGRSGRRRTRTAASAPSTRPRTSCRRRTGSGARSTGRRRRGPAARPWAAARRTG